MNAIEHGEDTLPKQKKEITYFRKLINYFKKDVDNFVPNRQRVRVCFDCRCYIPIHPDNSEALLDEAWFTNLHKSHRTQVVGLDELEPKSQFDPIYNCVSRNVRDNAKKELDIEFNK
jgi:hypothetical protein